MAATDKRDKEITREIHRLFWRANFQDLPGLIIGYAGRMPAMIIFQIFVPLITAYGVQAILDRQFDRVPYYALWVLGASLAYVTLQGIGSYAVHKNGVIAATYIQNEIFTNILAKDYEFFSNAFFGSLGAQAMRLRDAGNSYNELVTLSAPKQIIIIIASFIVIAYQSLPLAIVTIVAMGLVLSFTLWSSSWRLRYRRLTSEAGSKVAGQLGDALSHGATVKSFAMEDYELERLAGPLRVWQKELLRAWNSAIIADTGRTILSGLAIAAVLLLSANLYRDDAISVTIIVLVQLYVIKLVGSTLEIADIVKRYEEVMGGAYEPMKTMLLLNSVKDPAKPQKLSGGPYTVEITDMAYRYPDAAVAHKAIDHFSLKIAVGEKIGLVGYSGSGKTTLTKLLLRFMDVTEGTIEVGGIDIRDLRQTDLRRVISYVPQEPLLFHRSIAENIGYANPKATQKDILAAAKLAYVDEFVGDLPNGYETLVGERGVKLSGGQRQRVAIARALLKNAPILVLDEATSALDSKSERYIQTALAELMKKRTSIVIAHRLSTIQRLDRIVVMDKGKIVQLGTHDQLLKQAGIYADLWKHQSGGYIGVPTQ